MNWPEIKFWILAKWIIRRGYGADCETKAIDDFPDIPRDHPGYCASCKAKEVIEWIDGHIDLISPPEAPAEEKHPPRGTTN
jgi:hypothetical protein